MRYNLPYGIEVVVTESLKERMVRPGDGCGSVRSDLLEQFGGPDDSSETHQRLRGRAEALESFLLELACAGVNIGSAEFLSALEATIRALGAGAVDRQGQRASS